MCSDSNFKSCDPKFQEAFNQIKEDLFYQFDFDKITTPWETAGWDYEDLQSFKINCDYIDRLYYAHYTSDNLGRQFELIVRMRDPGNDPLYIQVVARCGSTGFDWDGGSGEIFLSRDANMFMKCVLRDTYYNTDAIYESLAQDGVFAEKGVYDSCSRMFHNTAPMLKYLCHKSIYDNIDALREYRTQLPKILADSVQDFIKTEEAMKEYDNIYE